jgi:hypothetical protein
MVEMKALAITDPYASIKDKDFLSDGAAILASVLDVLSVVDDGSTS